jgi:hypothetical protein
MTDKKKRRGKATRKERKREARGQGGGEMHLDN